MNYELHYHQKVLSDDISRIDKTWKNKIRVAIENKLTIHPEIFGKPLRQSLAGYRKLRVGDFRIVFRIENKTVKIFAIKHRREGYADLDSRIF